MGDNEVLKQIIESMADAAGSLEKAERENRMEEAEKIKSFLMDLQRRVKLELIR